MRLQKQLEQENFLLDMKNNHYESELEVEMELKQVAQKGCGIPILGDEQNLADREGSDHPSCHSFGDSPAEDWIRFSPDLPHNLNIQVIQYPVHWGEMP